MLGQTETYCTVLVNYDKPFSSSEIKESLESGSERDKREAMKKCVYLMLNGENMSQLFMTIVRYVLPSEDHTIQKLLLLYLEQLRKTDAKGKLLPEMILICQNLRNNLQHPNEYLRGVTLRFLCRIKEIEILEPLIPSILSNLEHRHSFVRRNAVSAVKAIYELAGENLLPDAAEMIERFLSTEQDVSARRNALMMLCTTAPDLAVQYLLTQLEQLPNWVDILQIVVLDLVRKVCRTNVEQKGKYIKLILALMSSKHSSVAYECATTLIQLSHAQSAIKAAANCFCQLLVSHSENNVKLIVLDRLQELKEQHSDILSDMVMDILRALNSPIIDIKKKTLDIVLDLLSQKNIEEVILALKKEVVKTDSKNVESGGEHRHLLVQAIHRCAMSFPDTASTAVPVLMGFLTDTNTVSALDVIYFVREIMETNPKLRSNILSKLVNTFGQIRSSKVCACSMWIIGEYSNTADEVSAAIQALKDAIGPLPFFAKADDGTVHIDLAESVTSAGASKRRPTVLSDGTYATQAASESSASFIASPNLRALIFSCDYFVSAIAASTYTKLVLKLFALGSAASRTNEAAAKAMLYIVSVLRLSESGAVAHSIDSDSKDQLSMCLNILSNPSGSEMKDLVDALLKDCKTSFSVMVEEKRTSESNKIKSKMSGPVAQPDDLIDFYHLKNTRGMSQIEIEDSIATDLQRAMGSSSTENSHQKLNRVVQLVGFSDPVYAEALMTVHQYDIVLDISVINRTSDTIQNMSIELATMGDLKLVERPPNCTLGSGEQITLRANIKVSSTETGVIFGNIVYDSMSGNDRNVVVLNDIHIDIMDYINPASCEDTDFRGMWAEFEWENKVAVNTSITDVNDFLQHMLNSTNMMCLTPTSALEGDCGYLAANLYTQSVFGEDALVNISIEKQTDGKLCGYVRIRSKTQGIALSLGDKITVKQKSKNA